MHPDHFYLLSLTHPLKIVWLCIFGPAFAAASIFIVRARKAKGWLATAVLTAVLAMHIAYSAIAPALYFHGRWYAPEAGTSHAPTRPD